MTQFLWSSIDGFSSTSKSIYNTVAFSMSLPVITHTKNEVSLRTFPDLALSGEKEKIQPLTLTQVYCIM